MTEMRSEAIAREDVIVEALIELTSDGSDQAAARETLRAWRERFRHLDRPVVVAKVCDSDTEVATRFHGTEADCAAKALD
jgi:hypothetical protein